MSADKKQFWEQPCEESKQSPSNYVYSTAEMCVFTTHLIQVEVFTTHNYSENGNTLIFIDILVSSFIYLFIFNEDKI